MNVVTTVEATSDLATLLDRVSAGERITITREGVSVARLEPVAAPPARVRETIARLKAFSRGQTVGSQTLGGLTIRELIDEGRQ